MSNILILLQLAVSLLVQAQTGTIEQKNLALQVAQNAMSLTQQYMVLQNTPIPHQVTIQPSVQNIEPQTVTVPVVQVQPIIEPVISQPMATPIEPQLTQVKDAWELDKYWQVNVTLSTNEDLGGKNIIFWFTAGQDVKDTINEVTFNGITKSHFHSVEFQGIQPGEYPMVIKVTRGNRFAIYSNKVVVL